MREILFRGKRVDNGAWEYGGLINTDDGEVRIATSCLTDSDITIPLTVCAYMVDPATVGQFTGLLDKNGNKIFEGDIVRDLSVYSVHEGYLERAIETLEQIEKYRYTGAVAAVEFCTENVASCGCCYPDFVGSGFKAQFVDLTCCEVIGNKWDNPELLAGDGE